MKSEIKLICSSLVLLRLFTGCYSSEVAESKHVDQSQIYQVYHVFCNEDEKNCSFEAVFRFGGKKGTTLILSPPSKVLVNGIQLSGSEIWLRGQVYSDFFYKQGVDRFVFQFFDYNNKEYKNPIRFNKTKLIDLPDSLSLYQTTQINWIGPAIQSDESVYVEIIDANGQKTTVSNNTTGEHFVNINPSDLMSMAPGVVKVRINRYIKRTPNQCGEIGGVISCSYTTASQNSRINNNKPVQVQTAQTDTINN